MHPAEIIEIVNQIKARRCARFPEAVRLIEVAEAEYPEEELPWLWLSMAINNPLDDNLDCLQSMAQDPWLHQEPDVRAIWAYIISPAYRRHLLHRKIRWAEMNKPVQRLLSEAIAQSCQSGNDT